MNHWVIGDVHGSTALRKLLQKINYAPGLDKLTFVGDLFDRGFDPYYVWTILQIDGVDAIMGNHERKFLRWYQGELPALPPHYKWAMQNLASNGVQSKQFFAFLQQLPLLREVTVYENVILGTQRLTVPKYKYVITHAGVDVAQPTTPNVSWNVYGRDSLDKEDTITPWWDSYAYENPLMVPHVLYGHSATRDGKPRIRKNSTGLDGAACHGRCLLAFELNTQTIVSVDADDDFTQLKTEMRRNPPEIPQAW